MIGGLGSFIKNQPVRAFALLCVAITSGYVMVMGWRLTTILSSPGWCNRTLAADKVTNSNFDALASCIGILTIQLKSLATQSHIYAGVIALCLLALMVIVVAGGHLSFTAPGGIGANVGASQAADEVADAAVDKAEQIKGGVA